MKRKIALAVVFVTPGRVVTLGMAAYQRNRALLPGQALGKSTETFNSVNKSQALTSAREDFLFSSITGAPA